MEGTEDMAQIAEERNINNLNGSKHVFSQTFGDGVRGNVKSCFVDLRRKKIEIWVDYEERERMYTAYPFDFNWRGDASRLVYRTAVTQDDEDPENILLVVDVYAKLKMTQIFQRENMNDGAEYVFCQYVADGSVAHVDSVFVDIQMKKVEVRVTYDDDDERLYVPYVFAFDYDWQGDESRLSFSTSVEEDKEYPGTYFLFIDAFASPVE